MPDREQLGVVTCPSGVLIVIDTGYLGIWSHNQAPILPDGALETEEARAGATAFVDLHVVGAYAELAKDHGACARGPVALGRAEL